MAKRSYHLHLWRRVSQVFFLLALNPYFFLFRGFCFPAMNCWACPAAAYGCPVGGIGEMLAVGHVPFIAIGAMLVAGAFLGRLICGWVCPFGLIQDLLGKLSKRKLKLPKAFSYLKYAILLVMVFAVPLIVADRKGIQGNPAYFCTFCPAGTLEAAIPVRLFGSRFGGDAAAENPLDAEREANIVGVSEGGTSDLAEFLVTSPRMWVLYAFLLAFVFIRRPFCRGICPIGAMFALLNRFSMLRMRVEKESCKSCNLCTKKCPVDNQIHMSPSSDDCIRCLECVDNCKKGCVKVGVIEKRPREDYWE